MPDENKNTPGSGKRTADVTRLLKRWQEGDGAALDALMPVIHRELQKIAQRSMRGERGSHTLQTTALVNEAYMRLIGADVDWADRVHFYAVAARQMRRVLVDHARAKRSVKRGAGQAAFSLDDVICVQPEPDDSIIALDEALERLLRFDERKGQVIELHYFGGMTYDEVANALEVSAVTVHRDLKVAKAWLFNELQDA